MSKLNFILKIFYSSNTVEATVVVRVAVIVGARVEVKVVKEIKMPKEINVKPNVIRDKRKEMKEKLKETNVPKRELANNCF